MRMTALLFAIAFVGPALAQEPARDERIRPVVEHSLAYLEQEGVRWIEERKCVSCHQVPFLLWSHHEARRRGLRVDSDKLARWTDWSIAKVLAPRDDGGLAGSSNIDGVSQLILAGCVEETPRRSFSRLLVDAQNEDGSWSPCGQLPGQRRPKEETTLVSTMWNVLALSSAGSASAAESVRRTAERARAWFAKADGGTSSEYLGLRVLLDGDEEAALARLKGAQREDGGWSWIQGENSDALATGQSLYFLRRAGVGRDDSSVRRAVDFLLETREEDGSWRVRTTLKRKEGKFLETSAYWGTGWATIGLLSVLPRSQWF